MKLHYRCLILGLTMKYFLLFIVFLTSFEASGTFFPPRPPKVKRNLDSAQVAAGKEAFFLKNAVGVNCASCHAKGKPRAFHRRKLSRVINKLAKPGNKCNRGADRMNRSEDFPAKTIEALRLYLASENRLSNKLR